jgi:hypothetical protein
MPATLCQDYLVVVLRAGARDEAGIIRISNLSSEGASGSRHSDSGSVAEKTFIGHLSLSALAPPCGQYGGELR